jgi:hypothetical protein
MSKKRKFWITFGCEKPGNVYVVADKDAGVVCDLKRAVKLELSPRLDSLKLGDWDLQDVNSDKVFSDGKALVSHLPDDLKVVLSSDVGVCFKLFVTQSFFLTKSNSNQLLDSLEENNTPIFKYIL